jgi:hypothetical protein
MIKNRDLGYMSRCYSLSDATQKIRSVQLLNKKQFSNLFPDATIICEKYASGEGRLA